MPAAATISQTSFASHTGPMELITARRSSSLRAMTLCSMPTPMSNPSSTKNPIHSTAMMMNQSVCRDMAPPGGHRGDGGFGVFGTRLVDLLARVLRQENAVDHREHAVQDEER